MNNQREQLQGIINNFSEEKLQQFFRSVNPNFRPIRVNIVHEVDPDPEFINSIHKLGEIEFDDSRRIVIVASSLQGEITERTSKQKQFEIGWKYLKNKFYDAGIFVYYDERGHFRFSLIVTKYTGNRRTHTPVRRYTYYVHPDKPNKTFINQIGKATFSDIDAILKTFSIEAVSNDFYNAFNPKFREIAQSVKGTDDINIKEGFALLFAIRIIFLGFVQKRGWLGGREEFIKEFLEEYQAAVVKEDTFYQNWLAPLFFEALNTQPGHKVKYQNNEFSSETEEILQMAPYLNGELFKKRKGYDDQGLWIPDKQITEFIEFLFQYNFTIEENTYYDEELELNPEFLGIIFERLVNKEHGAIYTPRTEVDFMCRMALVKWLEKNNTTDIEREDLYNLFFRDRGAGAEHQKQGDFTTAQIRDLIKKLENVTACDPAAGSGAFEVGMLQVLHEVIKNLRKRDIGPSEFSKWKDTPQQNFKLKKNIIARSLYGVEVKEWAVWINHLRLWLTLFIDMPDDYKTSLKPLLPSLNFKVRTGDSLVQRIGSKLFPVQGHAHISSSIKRKITKLKKAKTNFFYNRGGSYEELRGLENRIFREILEDEIRQKHRNLKGLADPKPVQGDLLGSPEPKQGQLEVNEQEKERLHAEIEELEEQKKLLGEQHPLIWNIEFAEIFFDGGGFDVIIGNPPYVRQEDIADPSRNGALEPKAYKKELNKAVRQDFDSYFSKSVKISGRSDLYTYFYIRSLRLLNSGGVLVFICSNSWLDVGYGKWLQRFLLKQVPVHAIVDNHAKRSFASADVNTVITIMESPDTKKNGMDETIRFIAFKKPFEETIIADNLLAIERAEETLSMDGYRVFPVTKQHLLEEGSEFENEQQKKMGTGVYVGDKWGGKYLRAPDIFFTILEKGEGKLVKLKDVAEVRLGIKTGGNEFFFLTKEEAESHGIEKQFLKPAILKTDSVQFVKLSVNEFEGYFFWCGKEKEEIKGTKALEYIHWGENQPIKIKQGKNKGQYYDGFHQVSSVKGRKRWYDISNRDSAPVWWMIAHNERSISIYNDIDAFSSNNFFEILPYDYSAIALSFYLTATISCFYREILGRSNYGGGLLKTEKPDLIKFDLLRYDFVKEFDESLPILERKSESIFTECGINTESDTPISEQDPQPLPDRAELDNIVFDALGLTDEERKEVYRAVCQLVWNRVSKAKSV